MTLDWVTEQYIVALAFYGWIAIGLSGWVFSVWQFSAWSDWLSYVMIFLCILIGPFVWLSIAIELVLDDS